MVDNQYHIDTHNILLFAAQKYRRGTNGAANYYHRTVNKDLNPNLEAYYASHVDPLLKEAGYPKIGSEEHHNVIKKIISNWRDEDIGQDILKDESSLPHKADGGGITAYHASPLQLSEFKPSNFRGSTFFAPSPKRAIEGAGAGANEMVMDTATELKRGPMHVHEVSIDPKYIAGLHYTPEEKEWFASLPNRIVGDDDLEKIMKKSPNPYIPWEDVFEHRKIGDRLYEYNKRKKTPSISYEQAYKTGRDVYGRQHGHYGTGANEKEAAKSTLEQGMKGYLVHDEGGLSIAMADPSVAKIKRIHKFSDGGMADNEGITAYHGSPHDFDKFDMSKIGTGEGAQAYSHGLYFAEREPVAREYRDRLAKETPSTGGTMADAFSLSPEQYAMMDENDLASHVEDIQNNAVNTIFEKGVMKHVFDDNSALIDDMSKMSPFKKEKGHMYEVSINSHPDNFLDWDAPLSNQSEHVKKSLVSLGFDPEANWTHSGLKGSDIYKRLVGRGENFKTMGVTPEAKRKDEADASEKLSNIGIKGVKYLDAGSRRHGEGSRNYVVFDDKLVHVKRKYALGGMVEEYADGGNVTLMPARRPRNWLKTSNTDNLIDKDAIVKRAIMLSSRKS
jgi:hypothetical protein